jgi:hypothetical protein
VRDKTEKGELMSGMMIFAAILTASPVSAQVKPAAASAGGVCAALARDYDAASKDLAVNEAEGIGDNSAPRATLRAMEDANTLSFANITLALMRDNHCPMPKSAPAAVFYLSPALTCATDRLKGTASPPSCDRSTWQSIAK